MNKNQLIQKLQEIRPQYENIENIKEIRRIQKWDGKIYIQYTTKNNQPCNIILSKSELDVGESDIIEINKEIKEKKKF